MSVNYPNVNEQPPPPYNPYSTPTYDCGEHEAPDGKRNTPCPKCKKINKELKPAVTKEEINYEQLDRTNKLIHDFNDFGYNILVKRAPSDGVYLRDLTYGKKLIKIAPCDDKYHTVLIKQSKFEELYHNISLDVDGVKNHLNQVQKQNGSCWKYLFDEDYKKKVLLPNQRDILIPSFLQRHKKLTTITTGITIFMALTNFLFPGFSAADYL